MKRALCIQYMLVCCIHLLMSSCRFWSKVLENHTFYWSVSVGGAMALWLVRSDLVVAVQALAGDTVLCSLAQDT